MTEKTEKILYKIVIAIGIVTFLVCSFSIPYLGMMDKDFGFWRFMAMIFGAGLGGMMALYGVENIEAFDISYTSKTSLTVKNYKEGETPYGW